MSHTEGKLIQKGNFAYQLMHAGWRKGEEQFKNRLSFQVYADKDAGETDEDITRRLVACWNALMPVPTEWLEQYNRDPNVDSVVDSIITENDKLRIERDELVGILRRTVKYANRKPFNLTKEIDAVLTKYQEAS